jgi:hypothetical protein
VRRRTTATPNSCGGRSVTTFHALLRACRKKGDFALVGVSCAGTPSQGVARKLEHALELGNLPKSCRLGFRRPTRVRGARLRQRTTRSHDGAAEVRRFRVEGHLRSAGREPAIARIALRRDMKRRRPALGRPQIAPGGRERRVVL